MAAKAHASVVEDARRFEELGRLPAWPLRLLSAWFGPWALLVGVFVAAPLFGMALFLVGASAVGPLVGVNVFDVVPQQTQDTFAISLGFGFVWFGALAGVYGARRALALGPLQAAMAATLPDRVGGSAGCRSCGAPLTYGARDLGVRCAYCGCDNLLRIPRQWVTQMRRQTQALSHEAKSVEAAWRVEQVWLGAYRRRLLIGLGIGTGLMAALFVIEFSHHTVDPLSFSLVRSRGGVVLKTATQAADTLWYSKQTFSALEPEETTLHLSTTGPYCRFDGCRVYVRVPMEKGERWTLSCDVPSALLFVAAHRGYSGVVQAWQREWPGTYGPRVVEGPCVAPLDLEARETAWHLVAVVVPGDKPGVPLALTLRRAR